MNYCQWMNREEGEEIDGSYFSEFDEEWCCGAPAMWKRWGAWFCADHYDKLCAMYGEPGADDVL